MAENGTNPESLEKRVARLESQVQLLGRRLFIALDEPGQPPTPQPAAAPAPPAPLRSYMPKAPPIAFEAPARKNASLEEFFGGKLLLAVGVFAFFLGTAFFLKYAFDNGWIGPAGRVMLGLVAGVALMLGSEPILRRGLRYYSEALAGLGGAVLYVSLFSAAQLFHLISVSQSFIAMAIVTAVMMLLALRRDSERLAFVALLGGYVTPMLNLTPHPNETGLFTYLAILNSALLWLPRKTAWPRVELAAFFATQLYFLTSTAFGSAAGGTSTMHLLFATIFFVQFAAVPMLGLRRIREMEPTAVLLAVATAAAYYAALHMELFDHHRYALAAWVVGLAAFYLIMARFTERTGRTVFATIALALVTLGVGISFTGTTLDVLWSVEAAALIWIGLRLNHRVARIFGVIAFACAGLHIMAVVPTGGALFINPRFIALAALAACLGFASVCAVRYRSSLMPGEDRLFTVAGIAANAVFLTGLSMDVAQTAHQSPMALSLLWLVYAVALVAFGLVRNAPVARWEGLALFGAVVIKVFLVDLIEVNPIIRIVSFMATGAVLLAVSFAYQRANASRQVENVS